MQKKLLFILFSSLFLLIGCSAGDQNDVSDNEVHEKESTQDSRTGRIQLGEMEFIVPEDIEPIDFSEEIAEAEEDIEIVGYELDEATGANFSVIYYEFPPRLNVKFDEAVEFAAIDLGSEYATKENTLEINDRKWLEYVTELDNSIIRQRFLYREHTLYIFTYEAEAETEESLSIFDEILETVTF